MTIKAISMCKYWYTTYRLGSDITEVMDTDKSSFFAMTVQSIHKTSCYIPKSY